MRPLEEIDRIGPVIAAEMHAMGYRSQADLLTTPLPKLISDLDPIDGLTRDNLVKRILPMADMMRADKVTPALAKAFVEGNITSLKDLAWSPVAALQAISRSAGATLEDQTGHEVVEQAMRLSHTEALLLEVRDVATSSALAGATIHLANPSPSTFPNVLSCQLDADGRAFIQELRTGEISAHLVAENGAEAIFGLHIEGGENRALVGVDLTPGTLVADEFEYDVVGLSSFPIRRQYLDDDNLPVGSIGQAYTKNNGDTHVLIAQRRLVEGWQVNYIGRVSPISAWPSGSMVQKTSAGWELSDVFADISDWRFSSHLRRFD